MFGGFDPGERRREFFERKRSLSLLLALALYLALTGLYLLADRFAGELETSAEPEPIDVLLQPLDEPDDEEKEDPEDDEPEPEEEPEPPPPDAPPPPPGVKPEPVPADAPPPPPDATPEDLTDRDIGTDKPVGDQSPSYGTGERPTGTGKDPGEPKTDGPTKPPEDEPPKKDPPKVKASDVLTPDDTPAKPDPKNPAPEYPAPMQKRGIEGSITVKYTVHKSGELTKVVFVEVTNTATKPDEIEKSNEAMKKAVQKAMAQWKFLEPCKRDGKVPFTCTMKKKFPFKLKK